MVKYDKRRGEIVLVLLDIDGTLLNSDNNIDDRTINVVKYYNYKNRFVLCSARKPSSTNLIAKQLELKEKIIICYNGALIIEGKQKICEKPLSVEIVKKVVNVAKKYNISINIYSNDMWFANELNDLVLNEAEIIREKPLVIKDSTKFENLTIHKILLLGNEEKLKLVRNEINEINNITVCNSKTGYLEITSFGASKRTAFEYLLEYLSVASKDSLAIGDSYNDLELLQCVEIGIAMENSPEEVKRVAKYVTYSNDKNGVEYALKRFLK